MENFHDLFLLWLREYGNIALFFLLALGIIALPVPEETMLVFSGFLIHQKEFFLIPTFFSAFCGAMCGITVSYLIGRWGRKFLLKKYETWKNLKVKMEKLHNWFERFGKWTVLIGYFIPGIRHFTGVAAGMGRLEYPHFALFGYLGALLWTSTFLAVGYFFSNYFKEIYKLVKEHIDFALTIILLFILAYFWYKLKKEEL